MAKQVPETPSGPDPIGPYSVANEANGFVFISGQVSINPTNGVRLEGDVVEQTHRVMQNLQAILGDLGLEFADVVKTTIFLAEIADFPVVNGVYAEYFDAESAPARSTFQAGALPGGFLVEIEAIAAR